MTVLLDVNFLIALFDPDHIHHGVAHRWLGVHSEASLALCPLTENGLVRVMSQAAYPNGPYSPLEIAALLHLWKVELGDRLAFWPDSLSLTDPAFFHLEQVASARHLTDVYLLALALERGGRLVTFDARVPWRGVAAADEGSLEVVSTV